MKVTKNLTHIVTKVDFEAAKTEEELAAVFAEAGVQGFPAELDIAERTEGACADAFPSKTCLASRRRTASLPSPTTSPTSRMRIRKRSTTRLTSWRRTLTFPPTLSRASARRASPSTLESDAQRNVDLPVHSIVEAYVGGTAFAWYGINEYPRLKRILVRKLAEGGQQAKRSFILRASKAQVDTLEEF